MTIFRVLLKLELTRLARTSQVYTYVILPALLLLPTAVFVAFIVVSSVGQARIALPDALPLPPPQAHAWHDAIDLALSDADLVAVWTADPAATLASDDVDAAVLALAGGDGLDRASPLLERASRESLSLQVITTDADLRSQLTAVLEQAGDTILSELVVAAGGDPQHDLVVTQVSTLALPVPEPFSKPRAAWAYTVFAVSLVGFFFCSLTGVADRNEGITETLLAAPVRVRQLLAARLIAVVLLQVIACLLMLANVGLLAMSIDVSLPLPAHSAPAAAALAVSLLGGCSLCDALFLLVGTWVSSAKAANNFGGAVMLGVIALLSIGVLSPVPVWLPLAGVGAATTPTAHVIAGLSCILATTVVVGATAARVERRVDLKLSAERR